MRIAQVARVIGISPDWLRRLEREGRIPQPRRDRNGHRRFTEKEVNRLREILFEEESR
jgi:DNA-binding transcriptional MerR regulator